MEFFKIYTDFIFLLILYINEIKINYIFINKIKWPLYIFFTIKKESKLNIETIKKYII